MISFTVPGPRYFGFYPGFQDSVVSWQAAGTKLLYYAVRTVENVLEFYSLGDRNEIPDWNKPGTKNREILGYVPPSGPRIKMALCWYATGTYKMLTNSNWYPVSEL